MAARQSGASQALSAAKAGISERSGRSIESDPSWRPASQRGKRGYRTRVDRFEGVWASTLEPLLRSSPQLQARTLLEHLQAEDAEAYPDSLLRTLQRRVREWRVLHGTGPERRFPQDPRPGWQMQVDFTVIPIGLVLIGGEPLEHRLAHARLRWSGYSHAEVVLGGESMEAFQRVVIHALEAFGGSPQTIRTDSLSAAYRNIQTAERDDVTADYQALCERYDMEPTRNNRGESHENGAIESSHGHLKNDLEQQLLLRGSNNFNDLSDYTAFLSDVMLLRNKRCRHLFTQEQKHLQRLPRHVQGSYTVRTVKVSNAGNIACDRVNYVVPRRLIGYTLTLHILAHEIECYAGQTVVYRMPRHRPQPGNQREWVANYRDIIDDLIKKPGAFRDLRYRDALHPDAVWRQVWEALDAHHSPMQAVKNYLALLHLAAQHSEELTTQITHWLQGHLTTPEQLTATQCATDLNLQQSADQSTIPPVQIGMPTAESYNSLLNGHDSAEEVA